MYAPLVNLNPLNRLLSHKKGAPTPRQCQKLSRTFKSTTLPPQARSGSHNPETRLNLFRDPTEWGRDPSAEKWRPQRAIFYNQDDVFGGVSGRCDGWTDGTASTAPRKYHTNRTYANSETQFGRPLLVADGCIDSKLITPLSGSLTLGVQLSVC